MSNAIFCPCASVDTSRQQMLILFKLHKLQLILWTINAHLELILRWLSRINRDPSDANEPTCHSGAEIKRRWTIVLGNVSSFLRVGCFFFCGDQLDQEKHRSVSHKLTCLRGFDCAADSVWSAVCCKWVISTTGIRSDEPNFTSSQALKARFLPKWPQITTHCLTRLYVSKRFNL